jgi:hypothetical protein
LEGGSALRVVKAELMAFIHNDAVGFSCFRLDVEDLIFLGGSR